VSAPSVEQFEVSLKTPSGTATVPVSVPAGFVPVSELVPTLRRLGEQAQALEERQAVSAGLAISCRKGCAACCRMLVPVSPPEAFRLKAAVEKMPGDRRSRLLQKVEQAQATLARAGLLELLSQVADSTRQLSDEEVEPINRDYYALRLPCPFLENEECSIYEERPAACRELLVTSPAEWCQDIVRNPVRALPVPARMGTILSVVWARLLGGPARLIPLPLALAWAERHEADGQRRWKGSELLQKALDELWRCLGQRHAPPSPGVRS
jgi:Fe-S-cluster containining protein